MFALAYAHLEPATVGLAGAAAVTAAAAASSLCICRLREPDDDTKPYIQVLRDGSPEAKQQPGLMQAFDEVRNGDGTMDNIMSIHSLNPDSLRAHTSLYSQCMKGDSPLTRADREVVAVAVSLTNSCTCARNAA
eukprot:SAG31_NODE_612_length_13548_cov_171.183285_10_plen_134_part_00